jgi:hypothetical protein
MRPSPILCTRSPTPATVLVTTRHAAPATCTPRNKQTRFFERNKGKRKTKQNYPGFEFKPHQVNDSSQSNQGTDHLPPSAVALGLFLLALASSLFCASLLTASSAQQRSWHAVVPLGEVVTANVAKAKNVVETENVMEVVPSVGGDEVHVVSGDEGHAFSRGEANDSTGDGASNNENSWVYCFKASTITLGCIKEMTDKGYLVYGKARAPQAETVPEPNDDEAIVFEEFFIAGLRMPLHLVLADILLKFQAQFHQLMLNAVA